MLLFQLHQVALWFLFAFCPKGAVICILEVTANSLGNHLPRLSFIQADSLYGVHCI